MRLAEFSKSFFLAAGISLMTLSHSASAEEPLIFVSSFAGGDQGGIHAMTLH